MAGLAELIRGLATRKGVQAVILVSGDGLPIDHAAGRPIEPETIAALAATLGQHAARLGEGAGSGVFRMAVLEYAGGLLLLGSSGSGDWLAVLAEPDADIGTLLYDLRQHRAALTKLF
jgi:predicted regulator of Ras-like GTPase activity (Roadblock/LC7/MglB family)